MTEPAGSTPGSTATTAQVAHVPSDNTTLTEVLAGLDLAGFATHFVPIEGGSIDCGACGSRSPADAFVVESVRRLEGASEPDEMQSVVAAACPRCAARGVLVLGYGPAASAADADVSIGISRPGSTPTTSRREP